MSDGITCNDCKVFQNFKEGDSDNPCYETMGMNASVCAYFEVPETEKVIK